MRRNNYAITTWFTLLCLGVFIMQGLGIFPITKYAILPSAVRQGEYYRLFTGQLMHSGIEHIAANLISFWNLGTYCESESNRRSYLMAILLSALCSGLSVLFLSDSYTVGFSGVVFGVMGYFATLLKKNDGQLDQGERALLARMLLPNIIISIMPGVSWQGHLGGFIGGVIAGLLFA